MVTMFTGCYTGSLRCSFLQPEMRGKFNGDIVANEPETLKCLSYPILITILLLTNTIVMLMLMLTT